MSSPKEIVKQNFVGQMGIDGLIQSFSCTEFLMFNFLWSSVNNCMHQYDHTVCQNNANYHSLDMRHGEKFQTALISCTGSFALSSEMER